MDVGHLRSFTAGDAQLERELGELFLSTAELYLDRMARALDGDATDWTAAAHALKGASANLGAQRMAELAAIAEAMMPNAGTIAALRCALDEVRAFFEPGRG